MDKGKKKLVNNLARWEIDGMTKCRAMFFQGKICWINAIEAIRTL